MWSNGIVPLSMKGITDQIESCKFLVSHLEASGIAVAILECRDRQPLLGAGMRNQFEDDLQRGEGFGPPVKGNEGKESMLNLVPRGTVAGG